MCISHYVIADFCGPCEGNFIDTWVPGQIRANLAMPRKDINNPGGEPSLMNKLSNLQRCQRRLLCSFHDNRTPSSQRRPQLPRLHQQRKVPRYNLSNNSNRFLSSICKERTISLYCTSSYLINPASVISVGTMGKIYVSSKSDVLWFAVVEALECS